MITVLLLVQPPLASVGAGHVEDRQDKMTMDARIQAARHPRVLRWVEEAHRLYPPVSGDKALEKAVARYPGPKGNLQFPLDEPVPYDLIERIVRLRVKQDLAKAAAKRKKQKK